MSKHLMIIVELVNWLKGETVWIIQALAWITLFIIIFLVAAYWQSIISFFGG